MLSLIATTAALAASSPGLSVSRTGATAQARAFVRIVSAVTVRLGQGALQGDAPPAQPATVHAGGEPRPASLIEFQ